MSRVRLNIYEQRIVMQIVKKAQSVVHGELMKDKLKQWQHDLDNVEFRVLASDLLMEGSHATDRIEDAVIALQSRIVKFRDSHTGNWAVTPVLYNAEYISQQGIVRFFVARKVFDAILDFSKGFSQYSLENALKLPSPYAMRLYALVANSAKPMRFQIDELKNIFGVTEQYGQTADFIKRVIKPAKKCLDDQRVNSFDYRTEMQGRKVSHVIFTPIKREPTARERQNAKIATSLFMSPIIRQELVEYAQFSLRELSAHKSLLDDFGKIPDAPAVLADIINRSVRANKPKGMIIASMRGEVATWKARQLK